MAHQHSGGTVISRVKEGDLITTTYLCACGQTYTETEPT